MSRTLPSWARGPLLEKIPAFDPEDYHRKKRHHSFMESDWGGGQSFLPNQVAGMVGWWKADGTLWQDSARTTPAVADADPVGAWDDASGNGRHLLQATAGKRLALKLGIVNGKPILRSDGVDDFLQLAFTLAQPFTLFGAVKRADAGNHYIVNGAGGTSRGILYYQGGFFTVFAGTALLSTLATNTAWHVLRGVYNGASSAAAYDQAAAVTGNAGALAAGGITVASESDGTFNSATDYLELIAYNVAVSEANCTLIQNYLGSRLGLF